MSLDFRNINTLWSSLIVETLSKLGLEYAVISPGSRSTPLTIAFAQHQHINTIPVLDERSASFFALGIAKRTKKPVVLVCTSGTAGANFYPAIIEARYSHIPLIILTCDRPHNLRNCHAGQTIEQVNLYGSYPQWQTELSLPSQDFNDLFYLRQNIIYGWEKSLFPSKGVVHFNIPFDEPLAPILTLNLTQDIQEKIKQNLIDNFPPPTVKMSYGDDNLENYFHHWQKFKKGIIIAGVDKTSSDIIYCHLLAKLATSLNFPVLGEALSPVRNYSDINENLVINYDFILRNPQYDQELIPDLVILWGEYPTSKELRRWLNHHKVLTYIVTENYDNLDALHTNSIHVRLNHESFDKILFDTLTIPTDKDKDYLNKWLSLEKQFAVKIRKKLVNTVELFEGKISWILSQYLPENTPVFIANSMSVRYAEFFWQKNNRQLRVYFSRGANGIDGTLSTALGIAYHNQPTVLLTGDLAFLHDTNGLLINQKFEGSLTVILVNNNGGGIFEMLPIANYGDVFEDYFATPQQVDFSSLSHTYSVNYQLISNWLELQSLLINLPSQGISIVEIKTHRQLDGLWLRQNLLC